MLHLHHPPGHEAEGEIQAIESKPWHPANDVHWCVVRGMLDESVEVSTGAIDERIMLDVAHARGAALAVLTPERARIVGRALVSAAERAIARREPR